MAKFFGLNPSAAPCVTTKDLLKLVDTTLTLEIADLTLWNSDISVGPNNAVRVKLRLKLSV